MKALLRPASEADLRGIVQIERAAFADPWSEESFRRLLDGHSAIFQVAAAQPDSSVVGYVIAFSVGADAELLNIAVDPEHRLEGIAGQMLDALLRLLAGRGVGNVFLEVRESNVAARSLYRSRGFAEIGRRRNYYRRPVEDALVMRRLMDLSEGDEDQSAGRFADR